MKHMPSHLNGIKAVFKEMKCKEYEEAQKRIEAEQKRKAAAKKVSAERKAKKEYETYLKLKQKYEKAVK